MLFGTAIPRGRATIAPLLMVLVGCGAKSATQHGPVGGSGFGGMTVPTASGGSAGPGSSGGAAAQGDAAGAGGTGGPSGGGPVGGASASGAGGGGAPGVGGGPPEDGAAGMDGSGAGVAGSGVAGGASGAGGVAGGASGAGGVAGGASGAAASRVVRRVPAVSRVALGRSRAAWSGNPGRPSRRCRTESAKLPCSTAATRCRHPCRPTSRLENSIQPPAS